MMPKIQLGRGQTASTGAEGRHYCQQLCRRGAPAFYLSARWLSAREQRGLFAIAAFVVSIRSLRDEKEKASALKELADYRRILALRRYPNQPMWQEIAWAIRRFDLPATFFNQIISAVESDLDQKQPHNYQELENYCLRSAGVAGLLGIRVMGQTDQRMNKAAERLGTAIELTQILRRLDRDLVAGRLYLPTSLLKEVGLSAREVRLPCSLELKVVLAKLASQAAAYYDEAERVLDQLPAAQHKSVALLIELYRSALQRLTDQDFEVFGRGTSLPPWRQLWLLAKVQLERDLTH